MQNAWFGADVPDSRQVGNGTNNGGYGTLSDEQPELQSVTGERQRSRWIADHSVGAISGTGGPGCRAE